MYDDFSEEWTKAFNTADLAEGLAVACLAYAEWQSDCLAMRAQGEAHHLRQFAGATRLRVEGYPPEPRVSFNGAVIPISTMADYAMAVDRPAPLPLRFMMVRAFHAQSDEAASPTVADVAGCLRDAIVALRHLNAEPTPPPKVETPQSPLTAEEFTALGLVMFASVATTLEAQARVLSQTIPTTTSGRTALLVFADHLKEMAAGVPMPKVGA